jgi:peptidase M1-like protein
LKALFSCAVVVGATLLATSLSSTPAIHVAKVQSPGAYDPVVRYALEAKLDAAEHRVEGRGTVTWRNTSHLPQRELYLHLYLNAFKNERSVFLSAKSGEGFRGAGLPARWGSISVKRLFARELDKDLWKGIDARTPGHPDDSTDVRVPLPQAVAPGEELTLEMEWVSELPSLVLRTGHAGSFHMVAQWFPKLARLEDDGTWSHFPFHRLGEFYADFGNFDVRIDAPEGVIIGATGVPDGSPKKKGEGRVEHHYLAARVHDFAFAAWDGFAELTAVANGVALRCLYPPGYEAAARLELDQVTRGLETLGEQYGAYPYPALTIVHPPDDAAEAGGMEYPMLITTGGDWWMPLVGLRYLELVTVHELTHQWFQGLLASNEDRWPFLDEGVTQWVSSDVLESWYPRGSAFQRFGFGLDAFAAMRVDTVDAGERGPLARSADAFVSGDDYGTLVYSKTAVLLETLARVYGRDRFRSALGVYAKRHRFEHPTPRDLLIAIEEGLGADAADALRAGIFGPGTVDYELVKLEATDEESQVVVRRHGELRFPVEIELHDSGGAVERVSWDGEGRIFDVRRPKRLSAAVVDPDTRVLIDGNLANNAQRVSPARVAPRMWTDAALLTELLLRFLAP